MTKATKIKAVKRVFSLHKNGVSITEARQTVAEELGLNAGSTIWNWQRKLRMVTPTIDTGLTKVNNAVVPRQRAVNAGISTMKHELGSVFSSLIRKDGRYTTKEASAISQVSSIMLGVARHELDIHKYANKMNKRDISSVRNLLA